MANGEWRMGRDAQRRARPKGAAGNARGESPGMHPFIVGCSHSPFAIGYLPPRRPFAAFPAIRHLPPP
jgi:hypothetical protein